MIASGSNAHAEGSLTIATGVASHAEGKSTQALGDFSHTEGHQTIASGSYQHVQGQYNMSSSGQSVFIIGNGTSNANRSNLVFASGSTFQVTGSLLLTGSQTILGSQIISNILSLGNSVVASKDTIVDFNNLGDAGAGMFIIPDTSPTTPVNGAMYWDATGPGGTLYIYNLVAAAWESVTLS